MLNKIYLSPHAKERLKERSHIKYDMDNILNSECKWYTKDNIIQNSNYYLHSLYVTRKAKNLGFVTNGDVEVLFNTDTGVAITVFEVKDKFKPITKYINKGEL